MGWASGSYLAEDLFVRILPYIRDAESERVAEIVYEMFCDQDADDWDGDSLLAQNLSKEAYDQEFGWGDDE